MLHFLLVVPKGDAKRITIEKNLFLRQMNAWERSKVKVKGPHNTLPKNKGYSILQYYFSLQSDWELHVFEDMYKNAWLTMCKKPLIFFNLSPGVVFLYTIRWKKCLSLIFMECIVLKYYQKSVFSSHSAALVQEL